MNNFKQLKVWQKSVELAVSVYGITKSFPSEEKFGLISQVNRSGVAIASNIAEGAGRNTKKDFNNFLAIALGSSYELETQLIIASRIHLLEISDLSTIQMQIAEIQKMIFALQKSNEY
jgi:four helix bundle protein